MIKFRRDSRLCLNIARQKKTPTTRRSLPRFGPTISKVVFLNTRTKLKVSKIKEALAQRAENEAENKQMQLDVVDDSDRIFQDRSTELVRAQEQLGEMEAQLQRRRQEVLHAENRISRARSNCTTLEVNLKTYQVKHASLSENVLQLNEEVEVLERDLNESQRTLAKRRQEQEASDHAVQAAREESKAILNQIRCLQERIEEQDRGWAR